MANSKTSTTAHIKHAYKETGRNGVDDIATQYGLDGPGIECRWGRHFSHPQFISYVCTAANISVSRPE